MENVRYIYTLDCPITNDVRYVGQTNNIKKRYYKHIFSSSKNPTTHCQCWIKSLLNKGLKPKIKLIESCKESDTDWIEVLYISLFKSWGFNLTNLESGGNCNKIIAPETIKKVRLKNIGRKESEESKIKRAQAVKKAWECPVLRQKQREHSIYLNKIGAIGHKGRPSPKKGKPFDGDKKKLSESLKKYYLLHSSPKKAKIENYPGLIENYLNLNFTLYDLSKKYGIARTTISRLMKNNNIAYRNGSKHISKECLFLLRKKGLKVKDISLELKCSVAQVEKMIRIYKIYKNGN